MQSLLDGDRLPQARVPVHAAHPAGRDRMPHGLHHTCRVDTSRATGTYNRTPPPRTPASAVPSGTGTSAGGPSTTSGPPAPSTSPKSASARSYRLGSSPARAPAGRATSRTRPASRSRLITRCNVGSEGTHSAPHPSNAPSSWARSILRRNSATFPPASARTSHNASLSETPSCRGRASTWPRRPSASHRHTVRSDTPASSAAIRTCRSAHATATASPPHPPQEAAVPPHPAPTAHPRPAHHQPIPPRPTRRNPLNRHTAQPTRPRQPLTQEQRKP